MGTEQQKRLGSSLHIHGLMAQRQGCAALQGRGRGGLDRACHTKPGLVAYECSSCSYITGVLTPSAGSKERLQ